MIVRNIYAKTDPNLEVHSDYRGTIADVFFNEIIDHVAYITTKPFQVRGNHYHKETVQHILIVSGNLEYWYKDIDGESSNLYVSKPGDVITTPAYEIHALRTGNSPNQFIVFSQGTRGGKNYESDTFRVDNIIQNV